MILGLGMDLVSIPRVTRNLERFGDHFAARILADGERRSLPEAGGAKAAFLAARFAAKEAAVKALGTGFSDGIGPRGVEVATLPSGQPMLLLHGPAARRAEALGVTRAHLSLTHERDMAGAVVVLEGPPRDMPMLPFLADLSPSLSPGSGAEVRPGPAHKGQAGRVLIVGGSEGLSGAPHLAALGALRGGAGLITVAGPANIMPCLRPALPEATTMALPVPRESENREWSAGHIALLFPLFSACRAVVVGPGMGRGNGADEFVQALLELERRPPLVLDADALMALSVRPHLLALLHPDDVLTPHPGEAAALLKTSPDKVQGDRRAAVQALWRLAPAVWVLKGAGSLLATPEAPAWPPSDMLPQEKSAPREQGSAPGSMPPFLTLSPWNVPQLAVGGSGDVLAGLIGALTAQGHRPALAAALGVWQHALAGLSLAGRFPLRGCSPRDIADALPGVRPLLREPALPYETATKTRREA